MNEPATIEQTGTELVVEEKPKCEIVLIEGKTLAQVFEPNGLDPLIVSVREKALEAVKGYDISDDEGRTAISRAERQIASSKRFVDEGRVSLVKDRKAELKAIDREGARAWDAFEMMQKEVRAPLDEWEAEQRRRVELHNAAIHDIIRLTEIGSAATVEDLQVQLDRLPEFESRTWDEFKQKAATTIASARAYLEKRIEDTKAAEAERLAERERKRAEQLKARQDREARIAQEAADAARIAAEQVANQQRLELETAAQRAAENAERERQARVAEQIESQRQIDQQSRAAARAEELRVASEERSKKSAVLAKQRAKRDQEAAVRNALEAAEQALAAKADLDARRSADQRIVDAVNSRAIVAFVEVFREVPADAVATAELMAELVVTAIAELRIPNVTINY